MIEISNLKINLLLQTCFQILETFLPFLTAPYISRVLGVENLGIFSYTSSIVSYFVLFATLGTYQYGTRAISEVAKDDVRRSVVFTEIFILQIILGALVSIAFFGYLFLFCKENFTVFLVQYWLILSCLININWVFSGLELFKISVGANTFIRICTVISIFLFVLDKSDLWVYALIMSISTFLSRIVLWVYLFKYIKFVNVSFKNIIKNLKGNIMLFIPLLAMSVYHAMDKTMLGYLSTFAQSGYYYNADKMINIPVGIISGISLVIMPKMSKLIKSNLREESEKLFLQSLEGTIILSCAFSFGIAAIANEFIPIFFGTGYEPCIILTVVLAPVLLIKAFSFTARYQFLIPFHLEKEYTISVVVGAFVNLLLNLLLIPPLGAMGAVVGTIFAEFAACMWQFFSIRKLIDIAQSLKNCSLYIIAGFIMFVCVRIFAYYCTVPHSIVKIIIEILLGSSIYILIALLLLKRYNILLYNTISNMFINKIKIFN